MEAIITIGLDIAKSVFQERSVNAAGTVIIRRQLKCRHVLTFFQKLPTCVVGIEACATSHHRSREPKALGHTVRLMPPAYVMPYVKPQKNDAADAEATEYAPWYIVRSGDKKRGRHNSISHLLKLNPFEDVTRKKPKLSKRPNMGMYDDEANLKGRTFVLEIY